MRSIMTVCWVIAACCALAIEADADMLHHIGKGDYQHHDSGWIFPPQIGEFMRIGVPQDIDGSIAVAAHYARVAESQRISVVVGIYPADSEAATAIASARVSSAARPTPAAQTSPESRSEVRFTLDGQRQLAGTRATETDDAGKLTLLHYLFDTGAWIVKFQVTATAGAIDTSDSTDGFVRQQRWETLGLPVKSE